MRRLVVRGVMGGVVWVGGGGHRCRYIIYLKVSDIRSVSRGGTSSLRSSVIKWRSAFGTQSLKRVVKQNLENEIRKLTHICSNVSSNVPG